MSKSTTKSLSDEMNLSHPKYTLWYHNPNENLFTESTFTKVLDINKPEELFAMHKLLILNQKILLNGLFYIMKDNIKPVWNNKHHINGGSLSWKIDRHLSVKYWENLVALFISGNFNHLEKYKVTGISINPKKNCNILKIWFGRTIPKSELSKLKLPKNCAFKEQFKIFKIFKNVLGK